jgi:queuine tRNA-ribosyltransferase
MLEHACTLLPVDKPRYLMGIGTPEYILEAIRQGIDIFDCVFPTRTARNGLWFSSRGPIAIKKAIHERDFGPPDPECACRVCQNHGRAYLRHLFKCDEILHSMLASYHNLYFLHDLVGKARSAIISGNYSEWSRSFLSAYRSGSARELSGEGNGE